MAKKNNRKNSKKVKDERVLLGRVGVDSGQLVVCDPCYLENEWQRGSQFDSIMEMSQYKDKETGQIFRHPMNWNATYRDGMTYNDAIAKGLIEEYVSDEIKDIAKQFSYDGCCATTLHGYGGQLHYRVGHEGAGVVFSSGIGDGFYEVWATIGKVEGWGRRVKKVEIILIEDD